MISLPNLNATTLIAGGSTNSTAFFYHETNEVINASCQCFLLGSPEAGTAWEWAMIWSDAGTVEGVADGSYISVAGGTNVGLSMWTSLISPDAVDTQPSTAFGFSGNKSVAPASANLGMCQCSLIDRDSGTYEPSNLTYFSFLLDKAYDNNIWFIP